jgi:hypothetical protein
MYAYVHRYDREYACMLSQYTSEYSAHGYVSVRIQAIGSMTSNMVKGCIYGGRARGMYPATSMR